MPLCAHTLTMTERQFFLHTGGFCQLVCTLNSLTKSSWCFVCQLFATQRSFQQSHQKTVLYNHILHWSNTAQTGSPLSITPIIPCWQFEVSVFPSFPNIDPSLPYCWKWRTSQHTLTIFAEFVVRTPLQVLLRGNRSFLHWLEMQLRRGCLLSSQQTVHYEMSVTTTWNTMRFL